MNRANDANEKGILFSASMVRAPLGRTKMRTGRVAQEVRHPGLGDIYTPDALPFEGEPEHIIERRCPCGRPGDRLRVREPWRASLAYELPPPLGIPCGLPIPANPAVVP